MSLQSIRPATSARARLFTGGLVTIGEADIPPRTSGPPLHVHSKEDEAYLVLEGILTVRVGDERFAVPAGGLAWLPRGIPHTFANLTDQRVRANGPILPAGLEDMFVAIAESMQGIEEPPHPARIAEIEECHTLGVNPGERFDALIKVDRPGLSAFHCHILPHAGGPGGVFGMVGALVLVPKKARVDAIVKSILA